MLALVWGGRENAPGWARVPAGVSLVSFLCSCGARINMYLEGHFSTWRRLGGVHMGFSGC